MRCLVALLLAAAVAGCSKNGADGIAANGINQVGCPAFTDSFYDSIYAGIGPDGRMPAPADYDGAVKKVMSQNKKIVMSAAAKNVLASRLSDLYKTLTVDALAKIDHHNRGLVLAQLTAIELGDRTTQDKRDLQNQVQNEIQSVQSLAQGANADCTGNPGGGSGGGGPGSGTPPPSGSLLSNMQATLAPAVYGAWKTIATAYQSCSVLNLAPLTESIANAQGITVTGTNGAGLMRTISSVSSLDSTDYYLEGHQAVGLSCFNVAANPLIYNYGGKPDVTSEASPRFDFFTNAGTGQNTLGVDCSGFIYSAYAAAGLKMKRESALKAIDVYGISSDMMFDPQSNGLTCLNPLSYSAPVPLQAGDLIVEQGHVVMIDHLGADPLGLNAITNAASCTPSNMNTANFNFAISQSSPVKSGIGIDRYNASDYFGHQNSTMQSGLQAYAASLCQVKFGVAPQHTSSSVTIVRHASDSACLGAPVALKNQECLNSCPAAPPSP
jgi:hypothetical protein